jgi:hypothetical protein
MFGSPSSCARGSIRAGMACTPARRPARGLGTPALAIDADTRVIDEATSVVSGDRRFPAGEAACSGRATR